MNYRVSENDGVAVKNVLDVLIGEKPSRVLRKTYRDSLGNIRGAIRDGKTRRLLTQKQELKLEAALIDAPVLLATAEVKERAIIQGAESAAVIFRPIIQDLHREVFVVMFLDQKHKVIDTEVMFKGTISAASVHPREVVKECINRNAAAVIFCHNHPSNNCRPSTDDERITGDLKKVLKIIDVRVLDHIILSAEGTGYFSFTREGLL